MFPVNFARGMNWKGKCIILDEAQNSTPSQLKTFLTRIGLGSKYIVSGDLQQSDLRIKTDNGLDIA